MTDFGSGLMLTNIRVLPSPPRHGCKYVADQSSVVAPEAVWKERKRTHLQAQSTYLQQMCQLRVPVRHVGCLGGQGAEHISYTQDRSGNTHSSQPLAHTYASSGKWQGSGTQAAQ